MTKLFSGLWHEDKGQDLIEYSLLLAFIAFTVAGLAQGFGYSVAGVASVSGSQINAASTTVS